MYAVNGLTRDLKKLEDQGWLHAKHANLFKSITTWTQYRSNTTKITWVKGHSGIKGNKEANKLVNLGARKKINHQTLNLDAPVNTVSSGAKLVTLSQKELYRGIKKANPPALRTNTKTNLGQIQACTAETYHTNPTPSTIWRTTKHKDLMKKTREFIWKCIHDTFKIGKFWKNILNYKQCGICPKCKVEELMEHILTECTAPGREQMWSLAYELWSKRSQTPIPRNYSALLGCCLANFKKPNGEPDKGLNRLFRILISESMYMIWKIRCKCTITWNNDPTKFHSAPEIHNKWLQVINTRLKMDSIQTNNKIFKKKTINPKIVLQTWEKCLKDNLHQTRNWCGKMGVLVGIAPKRPPGQNR